MHYVSTAEYAKLQGIGVQRVRELTAAHRIPGVIRTGRSLLIPADAPLPPHNDLTSYKYEQGTYMSLEEFAKRSGVSKRRIYRLRDAGELHGVVEAGGRLFFPQGYQLPDDKRLRDGAYIGWRNRHKK